MISPELREYIKREVDKAPPLSDRVAAKLALILRPRPGEEFALTSAPAASTAPQASTGDGPSA